MTNAISQGQSGRDRRLDVFRGLALVMIFVNHVPGTIYENLTNRNFGFSDAAEGFVLMSGIAAGLAYSGAFRGGRIIEGIEKMWRRAGHLYVVHIVAVMIAIALMAFGARFMLSAELLESNNIAAIVEDPLGGLLGIAMLTHQPGYLNILPLYAVLLVAGPLMILIGLRSKLALVFCALAVWAAAGLWRLNMPNYPNEGGWFFNPLAWQLIFAVGLAGGMAMKEGRKLVPYHSTLFPVAAAYLVLSAVFTVFRLWGTIGDIGLPFFIQGFDKTFASLPRVLHVFALAYVLINLDVVRRFASHRVTDPLATLGQNGLAVFASGSVICIFLQVIKSSFVLNPVHDGVLLVAGLLVQYGIALYFSRDKRRPVQAKKAKTAVPAAPRIFSEPHTVAVPVRIRSRQSMSGN